MHANLRCGSGTVLFAIMLFVAVCPAGLGAVEFPGINNHPTYAALKNIGAGDEALAMNNVTLRREFATFTFKSGTLYFAAPVSGKVTGAVFFGDGSLVLAPKAEMEKRNLSLLTHTPEFQETFNTLVLRFTDNTYEELKKLAPVASSATEASRASEKLQDNLDTLRSNRYTRYNLSARILQDLLATSPGGLFMAFISGNKYSGKEVFVVDPQGVSMYGLSPEEVAFSTYNESNSNSWAVSHLEKELADGTARGSEFRAPFHIEKQKLDVELEKSAELRGTATATVVAVRDGARVVPMTLFRHFEIDSVTDAAGNSLPVIFETRRFNVVDSDDADNFSVILPKALSRGEKFTITTRYHGKEAVTNEGNGNYYPVERDDWYPRVAFGDYTEYEMRFRIPKYMKIAATGTLVSEKVEGDWNITDWKTAAPIALAGFNFGWFRSAEEKLGNDFVIASYANEESPDWIVKMNGGQGAMNTTSRMKQPLKEALAAVQLYSDYYGPISYKRISMTQQPPCTYGQAWPGLVWLPICAFFDSTVRFRLGVDDSTEPYWSAVTPHEVAHNWWGHTVGWSSYRDQWMSEGFSQFSAALFVQGAYTKEPELYQRIWKYQEKSLQQKNRYGYRSIDLAPLTMGWRANYDKAGNAYRDLAYGKGSFVLHMLRLMMWQRGTGDATFKEMMRDFLTTYANRPASTEEFKAIVEKHMLPTMNLDGNGKMDWFFNEWVYSNELPRYEFASGVVQENGTNFLQFRIAQSNVSDKFKMPVPIYIELPNGNVSRLGSIVLFGNSTKEQKVPLGNLTPKRAMINYYYDVLSQKEY